MQKSAHFPPPFPSLSPLQDGTILDTTYISQRDARYISHDKNFFLSNVYRDISPKCPPRERIPRIILVVSIISIRIYERNVKKLRSVESKLGTSSILKSETKSSRLPTYLENVHLPSRLSPSAFDESRLDSRLGQRFLPGPRIARRYSRVEKPSRRVAGPRKIFAEWNAELRYPRIKGD